MGAGIAGFWKRRKNESGKRIPSFSGWDSDMNGVPYLYHGHSDRKRHPVFPLNVIIVYLNIVMGNSSFFHLE